tara:strand:+ start:259 stop:1089 length:831 start_codon:yes stop_codon:yes gene_type:complete
MTKEWTQSELNRIYKDNPEFKKVPLVDLDKVIIKFLKQFDVNIDSATSQEINLKTGFKGGLIGIAKKKAQVEEWTKWKQWSLSHKDFQEFKNKINGEAEAKNKKIDEILSQPAFIEKWEAYFKKARDEEFVKNQKAKKTRAFGLIAIFAILGTLLGITRSPEENPFTKDNFGENWPFKVDSIELKCTDKSSGFPNYVGYVDGKYYSLNTRAKKKLGYPYPDEILDTNGLNNLRKLQVSKSGFLKYEPFTGLLTWYEIYSTIGKSPLGEAMDDFCGN